MIETVFRMTGCWGCWLLKVNIDGDWFSLLHRLLCGLCEFSLQSDRFDVALNPKGKELSLMLCRWWRSDFADDDDDGLWFKFTNASMFSRFLAGEKGFLSLLINALKSTMSSSIDSKLESLWHGLMGHGRGLDGGLLFVVKNDISSDSLYWIL